MKRRLLALILTIGCLFTFNSVANAVKATNSQDGVGSYTLTGPGDFKSGLYATATFGGVKAYCMDPGKNPVANGTDCPASVLSTDNDFARAVSYILSSNKDESQKGTAIRIVAVVTGKGKIKYNSSTTDSVNARCGYISAAYQAAKKAGVTVNSSGLSGYTSSGGTACTDWNVTGDVINFAAEALKAAKTAPKVAPKASEAPSAVVTTSGGKATVTVTTSIPVTVEIKCDSNTTGDCGKKDITSTTTFNLESKVNDSKQCGTFTATMTYETTSTDTGDKGCSEVTQYSCNPMQNYVGCSKMGGTNPGTPTDPKTGKTTKTDTITDPNGGGNTIHIKCDDKKKECPYTEDMVNVVADGDGLCDAAGKEVINIGEATLFTQDVEDCIIDNEKFLVASSTNNVCKTYCVEDYSFESDGLMLSSQDKDPSTGLITITAGSYFNFANPDAKATEKGVVKCYTKIDLNTFKKNVEKTAQDTCGDAKSSIKHSCNCTTDPDTNVTSCLDTVTTTTYTAHYTNNKIEWIPNTSTSTSTVSSCSGLTNKDSDTSSCKATYVGQVNVLIDELKSCAEKAAAEVSYDKECNSKVVFDYGFNMDPIELKAENITADDKVSYKAKCDGDYSKCSETSTTTPTAKFDLGVGETITYPTIEYVEKHSTITADYSLRGLGICNDYNEGTSNYPVEKDACDSKDGKTWVEGWPVKYDTPQGNYEYRLKVSDFGHIKSADKCKTLDHYVKNDIAIGCKYQVNGCNECEYWCDPENPACDYNECDQECIYSCAGAGCIYDSGNGLALNYQPISMINVDSSFAFLTDKYDGVTAVAAGRVAAPKVAKLATTSATHRNVASINWNTEKGKATLDVIEANGEEIYSEEPDYRVTLTPNKMNEIKKENAKETDGFLNKSLKCEIKDENKSMEYVTCTSKFLDDLRKEGVLEGEADFQSYKEIPNYVTGYSVVSERKSGNGPAWK